MDVISCAAYRVAYSRIFLFPFTRYTQRARKVGKGSPIKPFAIPEPCRANGNGAVVRTQHNLKPM